MHRLPALIALVFVALLTLPGTAMAQDHTDHAAHTQAGDREIQALSPDEVEGLLRGDGMGYALAAELNSYPGPRHVLDLESELSLTADQVEAIEEIFREMNAGARELGARMVQAERELDTLFRSGTANSVDLEALVGAIAALDGELRFLHLDAHLKTTALLTDEQTHRYDMERGHAEGHGDHHPH